VKLLHAQRKIANASDPLRVARRILTEKHEKTNGSKETRVKEGLSFEIFRSYVLQEVYLRTGLMYGRELSNLNIEREVSDAKKANSQSSRFEDLWVNHLGSYREYVPGLGYAISIRKRRSHNQDTYLMAQNKSGKKFMVCDGLGSNLDSAIASGYVRARVKKIIEAGGNLDKQEIVKMGDTISNNLGSRKFSSDPKKWKGATTLLYVNTDRRYNQMLRVGDSSAFGEGFFGKYYECGPSAKSFYLINAVGQPVPFSPVHGFVDGIEDYRFARSRILVCSDGVTTAIKDQLGAINRIAKATSDPVLFAERLARLTMLREMQSGYDDDVTIVIEDRKQGLIEKATSVIGGLLR
jgi:serine/threonine protein phosphatase PrpC